MNLKNILLLTLLSFSFFFINSYNVNAQAVIPNFINNNFENASYGINAGTTNWCQSSTVPAYSVRGYNNTVAHSGSYSHTGSLFQYVHDNGVFGGQITVVSTTISMWVFNQNATVITIANATGTGGVCATGMVLTGGQNLTTINVSTIAKQTWVNLLVTLDIRYQVSSGNRIGALLSINTNGILSFDDITTGISLQTTSKLTSTCEKNYPNSTIGFLNQTQSCETPPIDTRPCSSVSNAVTGFLATTWDINCNQANPNWEILKLGFNASNTQLTRNSSCFKYFGFVEIFKDNTLNSYFNNSNVFSTCYYDYTNPNITLSGLFCSQAIDCTYNLSADATTCDNICVRGYLYQNGNLIDGVCTGFKKVSKCSSGISCGSPTSCGFTTIYNETVSDSIFGNTNTTGASKNALESTSTYLFAIYIVIISFVGMFYEHFRNEQFILYLLSGIVLIFMIVGLIPTWLGISMGIIGISLGIRPHKRG